MQRDLGDVQASWADWGYVSAARERSQQSEPSAATGARTLGETWLTPACIACGRGQPGRVEVREWEGYVPVHFNHVAVAARDKQQSARFLQDLLGLPEPTSWGPFLSLTLDDGVRLDYAEPGIEFPGQHYALLVSDDVFDRALERIRAGDVRFWAGPGHTPEEITTNHGGRGVYFDDPSGHHFELITQPYGGVSGG